MIPKVLKDIENYLKNFQIEIAEKIEGEHRVSSLKDEGTVKSALRQNNKLKPHILDVPPRGFGDMVVLDYDMETKYVVNIKTSIGIFIGYDIASAIFFDCIFFFFRFWPAR